MREHFLKSVFEPRSLAVVGASERLESVAAQVLRNILQGGFDGDIYAVNPKHKQVQGLTCYPSLSAIERSVELVIIAIPAKHIPRVMRECSQLDVKAVIVLSAGFAEVGKRGQALQDDIVDLARTYNIPLVGPNCLGVIRPSIGLNATFAKSQSRQGHVALVAQSGAFCTALLDWADSEGYGFSAVASLGATADVSFGDVLDYLATDNETRSILLYIEGISDARAFISGLRVAARLKPVIVLKAGRNETGTRAAVSHTAALVGNDEVFDAAIQRAGAVRVMTVNQLFAATQILASGTRVEGPRLAIVTNGGGPGVMAADHAADLPLPLAELSPPTIKELSKQLPTHWSHSNPVDILGDADDSRYQAATRLVLKDANVDGLLVMLTPQGMTHPEDCARGVIKAAKKTSKPVLACWMGEKQVAAGRHLLAKAGIPQFRSPETGVDAFGYLACYRRNQKALLQVPPPLTRSQPPDVEGARLIIENALDEKRSILTNTEARAVLQAFHIPTAPSINVASPADALIAAESLGLPVAMKINSPDIPHKSNVGGVRLNIREPRSVRTAFHEMMESVKQQLPDADIKGITIEPMLERPHAREIMIGIVQDPVFGPVISFGTGGTAVEIFADNEVALPPLNDYLSQQLIHGTRASAYLQQFRNLPEVNLAQLTRVLQRISEIACELPEVQELDINPLLVDEDGVIVVDARIVVATPASSSSRRYEHMAIHPYPVELVSNWQLPDGSNVTIRPIRPEDAISEQNFIKNMSAESKYFRFMQSLEQLTPLMLARFTQIDYDREMALIAALDDETEHPQIIAVARYVTNPDRHSCEFALAVSDEYQHKGIGRHLMHNLMSIAHERGIEIIQGEVLSTNNKMLKLMEKMNFRIVHNSDEPEVVEVRRHL